MLNVKIVVGTTWEEIERLAATRGRLVYAMQTCWWKIGDPVYTIPGSDRLPCGPRREVLLETDSPQGFLSAASNSAAHYGKWGLVALWAGYHGNIVTVDKGFPTSFETWDKYNDLLDSTPAMKEILNQIKMPRSLIPDHVRSA